MSEKLSEVEYARSHAPLLHQETYTATFKKKEKENWASNFREFRNILPFLVMSSRADVY